MAVDLPTSAAITSSTVTNANQKLNFAALRDFIANMLGTDSSDKPAARALLQVAPRATRIDVASVAGTVDLTTNAPNTDDIRITGALAITAFTVAVGRVVRVTAGGAFTLTNNGSIVTQTGANIVCAAGDTFVMRATAANVVEILVYSALSRKKALASQAIGATAAFLTFPHGLGVIPLGIEVRLECTSIDGLWQVGDKPLYNPAPAYDGSAVRGLNVWADATNVYIKITTNQPQFATKGGSGTGGVTMSLDLTKWSVFPIVER